MKLEIRTAKKNDFESIRNICCLTGNNGNPIENINCIEFSNKWIGPYEEHLADWCWVAEITKENNQKQIVGYLTSCPDSEYYNLNSSIEKYFSAEDRVLIATTYKAHLHMNLLKDSRGLGLGKKLFHSYVEKLNSLSPQGTHVFCGKDPLRFYLNLGFTIQSNRVLNDKEVFFLIYRRKI